MEVFQVVLLAVLLVGAWSCGDFPTQETVNAELQEARSIVSVPERVDRYKTILRRLGDPRSAEQDMVVEYAAAQLKEFVASSNDVAVLAALDAVDLYGGFGNFMCGVYDAALASDAARDQYRGNPERISKLRRCVGISLSTEDLADF